MDAVNNLVTSFLQVQHSVSQEVPGSTLDSGLENTTSDQLVSSPLPSEGVLAMDSKSHPIPPHCFTQLELWPLPADSSS